MLTKRLVRRWLLLCVFALMSFLWSACGGATMTTATGTATASTPHSTPSVSLQLAGQVKVPGELKLADLQAFPKISVTTNPQSGHGLLGNHTYGGALLYDLVQKAQIVVDAARKNDILRKVVLVTGTDGYSVAVSLGEISPRFANKQVLVAYEEDGKPLSKADGFARLIVPGDQAQGRFVSNLTELQVVELGS